MTFLDLKDAAAVWLHDRKKTAFSDTQLGTLVNMAYPMIVAVIEAAGKRWNVAKTPIPLAVTSAAREYYVTNSYLAGPPPVPIAVVRKVVEVRRVDLSAGGRGLLLPFRELNDLDFGRGLDQYPELGQHPQQSGVYLYRDASTGVWVIGFGEAEPATQSLEVYYVPITPVMTQNTDTPYLVPNDFHHVIAMRAALIGKDTEERGNSRLESQYSEQVRLMLAEGTSLVAAGSQRI